MKISEIFIGKARRFIGAIMVLVLCLAQVKAYAAELVVVGSPSCPYCKAWEIEVGSVYNKTAESRIAPLRRVAIENIGRVPYRFEEPVLYTPTFILINENLEVGRILGYSDEAAFWGLLNEILGRLEPSRGEATEIKREIGFRFQ